MIEIRKAAKDELEQLVPIYRKAFEKHGIFRKGTEDVMKYLEDADGDFIIAINTTEHNVLGGLLLVSKTSDTGHTLARIKHVAVSKEHQGQGIAKSMFKEAENMVSSGKIEIHISENEEDALPFYEKMGYAKEGELSDHYRMGERCFILGKTILHEEAEK